MNEEHWLPLVGYPGYSASNLGEVRNDKRERLLTVVRMSSSYSYVGLVKDGIQVKRSVAKLISETFLPLPSLSTFTTPIHLDGDSANCRMDNLEWRPRWFAIKHTLQFRRDLPVYPDPVRVLTTGEIFENSWKAVLHYGLLYMDVILSIYNHTYVFPTMQCYEWALGKSR